MLISELTVYDVLKDKIKLSDSDAKRYAKEMSLAEERLQNEVKSEINREIKNGDYATKSDIKDLEIRIEKGFKEVIIWVIAFLTGIIGIAVAIIKLF